MKKKDKKEMMDFLHTDNLWKKIISMKKKSSSFKAAIGYLSSDDILPFNEGDIIVCDASDAKIKNGNTSAKLIKELIQKGCLIYSFEGLHSKLYVYDDSVIVGSANLSQNSYQGNIFDVGYFVKDVRISSQASMLIDEILSQSFLVDSAFLKRILKIKVINTTSVKINRRLTIKNPRKPNHWLVGIHKIDKNRDIGLQLKGIKKLKQKGIFGADTIEFPTSVLKNKQLKVNDLISILWRSKKSQSDAEVIYSPCKIFHIEKSEKITYVYYKESEERKYRIFKSWAGRKLSFKINCDTTKKLSFKNEKIIFDFWENDN